MNFGDVLTVTLTLFAVIDILGSIPIIIGLRSKMGHIQSEKATLVQRGVFETVSTACSPVTT